MSAHVAELLWHLPCIIAKLMALSLPGPGPGTGPNLGSQCGQGGMPDRLETGSTDSSQGSGPWERLCCISTRLV